MAIFYAHLNIVPNADFLQKMYVVTYQNTHQLPDKIVVLDNPDKWNAILTPLFNISRHAELGKKSRWNLERQIFKKFYQDRVVTRNNAMEKPVRFASDHQSNSDADWLQEYFIPTDKLPQFINTLKNIAIENQVNLLNVTIRYLPAEKNVILNYAKNNCFAVVLYFNQNLSTKEIQQSQSWTRNLINAALSLDGNYYLPYQPFASIKQFKNGYPEYNQFLKIKHEYDPNDLFRNKFYSKYLS